MVGLLTAPSSTALREVQGPYWVLSAQYVLVSGHGF